MNFLFSSRIYLVPAALILLSLGAHGTAQAASVRESAPADLTGYWVSVITEDWRWRMVTPAKGDYASIPITLAAKTLADAWDPAKDEAAGEACKSYGAPGLMRLPERLHITWQDDNTLKVETDAGKQVRLLHFGDWKVSSTTSLQGDSVATWTSTLQAAKGNAPPAQFGGFKSVTSHLRPGYLRKNGVPYSADALLTEYWDLMTESHLSAPFNGEQWLVITTVMEDPKYLQIPWLTHENFKKEPDGSKWDPQPCSARW